MAVDKEIRFYPGVRTDLISELGEKERGIEEDHGHHLVFMDELGDGAANYHIVALQDTAGLEDAPWLKANSDGEITDGDGTALTGVLSLYVEEDIVGTGNHWLDIVMDTANDSDNKAIRLAGGGVATNSQGGLITVAGNEDGLTGQIILNAGNVAGGDIIFQVASAEAMRIDETNGFIGIGKTDPDTKLEVSDTSTQLKLTHTAGVDEATFFVDSDGYFHIKATGNKVAVVENSTTYGGESIGGSAYFTVIHNDNAADNANLEILAGSTGNASLHVGWFDAGAPKYLRLDSDANTNLQRIDATGVLEFYSTGLNLTAKMSQTNGSALWAPDNLKVAFGNAINSHDAQISWVSASDELLIETIGTDGAPASLRIKNTVDATTQIIIETKASPEAAEVTTFKLEGSDWAGTNWDVATDHRQVLIDSGGNIVVSSAEVNAGGKTAGHVSLTAAGMWPSTTNGCADAVLLETAGVQRNIWLLDFDKDADEYCEAQFNMPDDWDGGTFTAQFFWTFAANSGTVQFGIQMSSFADGDDLDGAWGSWVDAAADTALTAEEEHITAVTGAITVAGAPAAKRVVYVRIRRDVSDDNLGADARLKEVYLTYTRV